MMMIHLYSLILLLQYVRVLALLHLLILPLLLLHHSLAPLPHPITTIMLVLEECIASKINKANKNTMSTIILQQHKHTQQIV